MNLHDRKWKSWRIDLLGLFVCIAVSGLIYVVILRPATRHKGASATQYQQRLQQEEMSIRLARELASLRQKLKQIEQRLGQTQLQIRQASSINQHLASLTELANAMRIQIDHMQPGAPIRAFHFDTIPIQLSGMGSYPNFARFLKQLHVDENFLDTSVSSFELAADPASESASFRLELAWYTAPSNVKP